MDKMLLTSSSPHFRGNESTRRIMIDVLIALVPSMIVGVMVFGIKAVWIIIAATASSVTAEMISRKAMKKDQTIGDMSAVVTGVLLALNFSSEVPIWIPIVGGAVAIVIVKQLFGGIGQNFMNPALGARVILVISWPSQMTKWLIPGGVDGVSSATPLGIIKEGGGELPSYIDMFIGNIGGCIGETSVAAILLGAAYLVARRVIKLEIPLMYIGTFAVLTWIFTGDGVFSGDALFHILAGGLMLGAFFMATDYSSTPMTKKGKIIFGFGCGLLTFVIRFYTGYPEGVSFSIILMNLITPLIDMLTIPVSFGGEKKNA